MKKIEKKLGKLKLNQFSKDEMDRRKINELKGGCSCTYGGLSCSCILGYYGSSDIYLAKFISAAY